VRATIADFIAAHPGDFADFVETDPVETGSGAATTNHKKKEEAPQPPRQQAPKQASRFDKVRAYCERLRSTAMWGGHVEIVAAARALGVPIIVHTADSDDLVVGPEFGVASASPLRISFHKHAFTLGEHYNSVVDTAASLQPSS